jgi:hypothetical protein
MKSLPVSSDPLWNSCRHPGSYSPMAIIFHDKRFIFVYHYLGDLVIYIYDFDHLVCIAQVLSRLCNTDLTVKHLKVVLAIK